MDSYEKAVLIARICVDKKADDVKVIDIREISTIADFFVICSGPSTRRTEALREEIERRLYLKGIRPWHREGLSSATWIILDYGDVIVHIFYQPIRKFYDLDRLWGEGRIVDF